MMPGWCSGFTFKFMSQMNCWCAVSRDGFYDQTTRKYGCDTLHRPTFLHLWHPIMFYNLVSVVILDGVCLVHPHKNLLRCHNFIAVWKYITQFIVPHLFRFNVPYGMSDLFFCASQSYQNLNQCFVSTCCQRITCFLWQHCPVK